MARVLGAALLLLAITSPAAMPPVAAQVATGITWEQRRANLERLISEIESGQMLWVPEGSRLVPVRRDDYRDALVLDVIGSVMKVAGPRSDQVIPEPQRMGDVANLARAAVAATEGFRRALVAELQKVNQYLASNTAVRGLAFDPGSPQRVREHLLAIWNLKMVITDRSPDFRREADILRQAAFSTLTVTDVTCPPMDPPKLNCRMSGRVNLRGAADKPIQADAGMLSADRLVEDLRMASYSTTGAGNAPLVRFRISSEFAGGSLDFSASVDASTGGIVNGTISWAASGRSVDVGTWEAVRQR